MAEGWREDSFTRSGEWHKAEKWVGISWGSPECPAKQFGSYPMCKEKHCFSVYLFCFLKG